MFTLNTNVHKSFCVETGHKWLVNCNWVLILVFQAWLLTLGIIIVSICFLLVTYVFEN